MAINVDVKRTKSDNSMGLLRKFSRKVKTSGVVREKRSRRYFERPASDFRKKEEALNKIQKRKEYERLDKLGLLTNNKRR